MRKFGVLLICLAVIVALFSINNADKTFSFDTYITAVAESAEDRPIMPSTENIQKVVNQYGNYENDTDNIVKALEDVWNTLVLIYECIVFAVMFLVYIVEMIIYILEIVCACTYNLFVW